MSGKRLLDAVALYRATKSVASKHAALRTRQLEAYKKTSSVARAVANQTDKVSSLAKGPSASLTDSRGATHDHSVQGSSNASQAQSYQVPSHDSVQSPARALGRKQGLEQDHFYERSEQNTTTQPPPGNAIGVQQAAAKRYPLPDGSIPPVESEITTAPQQGDSYSDLSQTEPVKKPLQSGTSNQPEKNLEPTSSKQSTIPAPSNDDTLPAPSDARTLQRQAEQQIPSQAAEPPPAAASNVDAPSNELSEGPELGVDQERDVFYTPSPNTSRVLSALPRVKLPKNTVSDERINQDVFYTSREDEPTQALPQQQAVPQQEEPSEAMYSELFHSPKVAKMLKERPKPVDSSKGVGLKGVKRTPIEDGRSTPAGDPGSFHTRPTKEDSTKAAKVQKSEDRSTSPSPPQQDDIQALAADIAADVSYRYRSFFQM